MMAIAAATSGIAGGTIAAVAAVMVGAPLTSAIVFYLAGGLLSVFGMALLHAVRVTASLPAEDFAV